MLKQAQIQQRQDTGRDRWAEKEEWKNEPGNRYTPEELDRATKLASFKIKLSRQKRKPTVSI